MANPTTKQATAKPPRLVLEREFDATPERLWTYWTDPAKYARWLSPQKADLVIHEWDLRVGGKVRFDMPLDAGGKNPQEGVFHVLDPARRLVSGNEDRSFLIDVTFTPLDGGKRTKLTVLIDGVPADWHAAAKQGWGVGFGKLDALLAKAEPKAAGRTHGANHPPTPKGVSAPGAGHVKDRTVFLERWFNAPPGRVYKAWTDPALLPKFFWPFGTGVVKECTAKVGGRLVMGHAEFPDWTATWEFRELVPGKRIAIRDIWPDGSGNTADGTMEFLPENGGTRMKVKFGPFPATGPFRPEDAMAGSLMGMDRLAEAVEVPGRGEGFRLVRYFNAPPGKVFEMWTTQEGLAKWWALSAKDMGYAFRVDKLDARTGGTYDIVMSNKEHGELHNHGEYVEIVPDRRIVQRWDFDIFLGPGETPYPIDIVIELEDSPTMEPGRMGTKMTFTQGPMAKPDFTEGSRQGVISNLAKLEQALGAKAKAWPEQT
jgi:uncharacterized protein YndB with AHSA1/START domain